MGKYPPTWFAFGIVAVFPPVISNSYRMTAIRSAGVSEVSKLTPPFLAGWPRHFLDSRKDGEQLAPRWAQRFEFRGVVRNAMAMQPLACGSIVSIRATGTVAFRAELPRNVCTLRFNIDGRYKYTSGHETVCSAPVLLLPSGAHIQGTATDACILFVDVGCDAIGNALGLEKLPEIGMHSSAGRRGQHLRATAFAACRELEDLCPRLRPAFLRNFQNMMACAQLVR